MSKLKEIVIVVILILIITATVDYFIPLIEF